MPASRHYLDQLALMTLRYESSYNSASAWDAAHGVSFTDFDDASAHADWDDQLINNSALVTGREMATKQELVRQSVRFAYTEPYCKPTTLVAMLGLTLGNIVTVADSVSNAYRHRITQLSNVGLRSTRALAQHEGGQQWLYRGLKGVDYTLSMNDAYWQFQQNVAGSGSRTATSGLTFPATIAEDWLRIGDTKIYLRNTGGVAQAIPSTPVQTGSNLGSGTVDISERVTTFSHAWNNDLALDSAYRPGTGMLRRNPHGRRRTGTLALTMEMDTATEATELAYYASQQQLSVEVNCNSGVLLTAGGTFRFGFILIIPRLQFSRRQEDQAEALELLNLESNILADPSDLGVYWWIYTKQTGYYASGV